MGCPCNNKSKNKKKKTINVKAMTAKSGYKKPCAECAKKAAIKMRGRR